MAGQKYSGKRSHPQGGFSDSGRFKRRNPGDDREPFVVIDPKDTVYRYLCPVKHIGTIIGKGGEIVKQLRVDTKAKIKIGETVPGCEERVVTIYSSSNETNPSEITGYMVSPAQDALFSVHDRVIAESLHGHEDSNIGNRVTARLLVPSDQIGCIIGKGGQIVQNIRSETGAEIRILKDDHLPRCALSSDELVQISGEAYVVKKALCMIASRLHENPSRSQHLLASFSNVYPAGVPLVPPPASAPVVGLAPLMGPIGGDAGDWSLSLYSTPRNEASSKEFSLRLVCPTRNIGGVIGKGGALINQIRQETGAQIKVNSSAAEGDDCLIIVSSKEFFDNAYSPTIEATAHLQPRCSEKVERESGSISYTTRLLVPTSRIGCLIGKGGAIITELRKLTKANIRVISKDSKDDLPRIASEDDEMVQIFGEINVARDALLQVATRLKANLFDREGALSTPLPVLPYLRHPADGAERLNYDTRDSKSYRHGGTYSGGYAGSSDLALPHLVHGADILNYDSRDSKRYGRGETHSGGHARSSELAIPLPEAGAGRLTYVSRESKRYGRGGTYAGGHAGSSDLAVPFPSDDVDRLNYDGRDSKRHGRGGTYSGGYGGSSDLAAGGSYGGYLASQIVDSGNGYEAYGNYPSGRFNSSGLSSQNPVPRRRGYDY